MFAVLKTGGKQYRVVAEDTLSIERLPGDVGDTIVFDQILMLGKGDEVTLGAPTIAGALVSAEILSQGRGAKVIAFKKRRRQNSKRTRGHRQLLTTVRIAEIAADGKKPATKKADAAEKAPAAEKAQVAEKASAAKKPAEEKAAANAPAAEAEKQPMFDAPDGPAGDLKKIAGVGPVLEAKLNALGIISLSQVASFTKDDIDRVDAELNFKGRIEREDWIGQATQLADGSK